MLRGPRDAQRDHRLRVGAQLRHGAYGAEAAVLVAALEELNRRHRRDAEHLGEGELGWGVPHRAPTVAQLTQAAIGANGRQTPLKCGECLAGAGRREVVDLLGAHGPDEWLLRRQERAARRGRDSKVWWREESSTRAAT